MSANSGPTSPSPEARAPQSADLDRTANVLLQASQLTEHLRSQFAELSRREKNLSVQLGQLDHERRALRLWSQDLTNQAEQREADVRAQEVQLQQRTDACERLVRELERQDRELANERQQLAAERTRMKEEIERELEEERNSLRRKQAELQASQAAHARQREREEAEHKQLLHRIDEEHSELMHRLPAELQQQKEIARKEILEELDQQKTQLELCQQEWIERQARESATLAESRQECSAALTKERADWEEELRQAQTDLEARRQLQDEALRRHEADWTADFQAREQAAEAELRQTRDHIEQLKADAKQQIAAERQELDKQRSLFEGRTRFQMSHLTASREEFERERKEFRLETQQAITQLEQLNEPQRLARGQFERRRSLLAEREGSVERERTQLERTRRENERHLEIAREQLADEKQAWLRDKTLQDSELRRQQDMLSMHAENLEARRERLDRLRAELEESHRDSLELRIALEEASAQLQQAIGEEPALERIDEAREALSEYYHHLRTGLADQRRELPQEQTRIAERKEAYRAERKKLMEWVAERDRALAEQEQLARSSQQELSQIREQWVQSQQKWFQERSAAEGIIRDLLKQLDETDQQSASAHAAESRKRFEKVTESRQPLAELPANLRAEPDARGTSGEVSSTLSGPHTRPDRPVHQSAALISGSHFAQSSAQSGAGNQTRRGGTVGDQDRDADTNARSEDRDPEDSTTAGPGSTSSSPAGQAKLTGELEVPAVDTSLERDEHPRSSTRSDGGKDGLECERDQLGNDI